MSPSPTALVALTALALLPPHAEITRYVRFRAEGDARGSCRYGKLLGAHDSARPDKDTILELAQDFLADTETATGRTYALGGVSLLPPTQPRNIFNAVQNHGSHGGAGRDCPKLFMVPPTSIGTHGDGVWDPSGSSSGRVEAELVAVVKQDCHRKTPAEAAKDCIFGVTVGNDVTFSGYRWAGSKGKFTSAVFGPWVVTGLDWHALQISLSLDGQLEYAEPSKDMYFYPEEFVSIMSQSMTLVRGDLIFMGAIGPFTYWSRGQTCTVSITGVGSLTNTFEAADADVMRKEVGRRFPDPPSDAAPPAWRQGGAGQLMRVRHNGTARFARRVGATSNTTLAGADVLELFTGNPFAEDEPLRPLQAAGGAGATIALSGVEVLPPIPPGAQVFGIRNANYPSARNLGHGPSSTPEAFMKATGSLLGQGTMADASALNGIAGSCTLSNTDVAYVAASPLTSKTVFVDSCCDHGLSVRVFATAKLLARAPPGVVLYQRWHTQDDYCIHCSHKRPPRELRLFM